MIIRPGAFRYRPTVLTRATSNIPLTSSKTASKGSSLTLTRADATSCATVTDFEGLVKVCKANEARISGARRVENLLVNTGFSGATGSATVPTSWASSGSQGSTPVTTLPSEVVSGISTQVVRLRRIATTGLEGLQCVSISAGVYAVRIATRIPSGVVAPDIVLYIGTGTPNKTTIASAAILNAQPKDSWVTYALTVTVTVAGNIVSFAMESGAVGSGVDIALPQLENVTGQSNQDPSEYVSSTENSTGALGVRYMTTTNGNTVSNNVVTEGSGSPLTTIKGLLTEPSRTNLFLNSAVGTTQTTPALTAASYTLSFKGTGSISSTGGFVGTLAGTGATNRVSLTVTATAATATMTVTGSITEVQLELGANASSWIPTVGSSVTRAVDVATIPTSGNITAAAGSVYCEWTPYGLVSGSIMSSYVDASNSLILGTNGTSNFFLTKRVAGVDIGQPVVTLTPVTRTTYKMAFSWGGAGTILSVNSTSNTNVNTASAVISATLQNGSQYCEELKNLRTWTTQLTAAQLNTLTK